MTTGYLHDCSNGWGIMLYLAFSIVVSLVSVLCEICLTRISMKGTMVQTESRNNISFYLNSHMILGVCQFFCAIFGICVARVSALPCTEKFNEEMIEALLYLVIISQLVDIFGIVCCWTMFSSRSADLEQYYTNEVDASRPKSMSVMDDSLILEDAHAWERRCQSLCRRVQLCTCNIFGGSGVGEDLEAVGKIFSNFFHHEGFLDVVPSDVVAGVMLLRFQQKLRAIENRKTRIRQLKKLKLDRHGEVEGDSVEAEDLPPSTSSAAKVVMQYASNVDLDDRNLTLLKTHSNYLSALEVMADQKLQLELSYRSRQGSNEAGVMGRNSADDSDAVANDAGVELTLEDEIGTAEETKEVKENLEHLKDETEKHILGETRNRVLESKRSVVATDYDEIEEIAHYAHYALAVYSTLMFLYMHPCCGTCRLCHFCCCAPPMGTCNLKCCFGKGKKRCPPSDSDGCLCGRPASNGFVQGDNVCHLHEAAILKMAHLDQSELVYANFSNDLYIKPYAVFVDFKRKALVITVRGTLSLEDCVTDAVANPESMEEAGLTWGFDGAGRLCHSGMLRSAMWIREDLSNNPKVAELLEAVAGPNPKGGQLERGSGHGMCAGIETPLNQVEQPVTYNKLIVVGHSLGAGTAAVLGMLLKNEFPTVRVFGYGTPGSVFDAKTSHDISKYMTSCILGHDLVASLSISSLAVMREQVLDAIVRCRVNKMVIMQTMMFKDHIDSLDELMYPPGEEPTSHFSIMVEQYKKHMRKRLASVVKERLTHPGRIIHLRKIGKEVKRYGPLPVKHRIFAPFIASRRYFDEILISSSMVMDHLPDRYVNQLDKLVAEWSAERMHLEDSVDVTVS
eukprot:CAMPEP_0185038922 /NCGR_PEP_ID=MMETSP1103-20130426/35176_1 /TAXON_ID=36769 /ORGANISM="Paraphysomonas bandaiensis, Strain Caron Lab Isolate" /LENGTH=848 /DNA_ID=CAMNT_0027577587 /DNA_START=193 /DNA_END=2739 /DNA_ORIENTATION=-